MPRRPKGGRPPQPPRPTDIAVGGQVVPRGAIWKIFRFLGAAWALLFFGIMAAGVTSGDPIGTILGGIAVLTAIGAAPLGLQHAFAPSERAQRRQLRDRGIVRGEAEATGAVMGVMQGIEQIRTLTDDLAELGVLPREDVKALRRRLQELRRSARWDARSVALGGSASRRMAKEVGQLHGRLVALLDATIDAQVADDEGQALEGRLQQHMDALASRQRAVDELTALETHLRGTGDLVPDPTTTSQQDPGDGPQPGTAVQ